MSQLEIEEARLSETPRKSTDRGDNDLVKWIGFFLLAAPALVTAYKTSWWSDACDTYAVGEWPLLSCAAICCLGGWIVFLYAKLREERARFRKMVEDRYSSSIPR